jgi:hypothetical protein
VPGEPSHAPSFQLVAQLHNAPAAKAALGFETLATALALPLLPPSAAAGPGRGPLGQPWPLGYLPAAARPLGSPLLTRVAVDLLPLPLAELLPRPVAEAARSLLAEAGAWELLALRVDQGQQPQPAGAGGPAGGKGRQGKSKGPKGGPCAHPVVSVRSASTGAEATASNLQPTVSWFVGVAVVLWCCGVVLRRVVLRRSSRRRPWAAAAAKRRVQGASSAAARVPHLESTCWPGLPSAWPAWRAVPTPGRRRLRRRRRRRCRHLTHPPHPRPCARTARSPLT